VKNPSTVPFPTVNWPASDPLVTAVGGTYLCTNPVTGTGVDSADPPATCQAGPNYGTDFYDVTTGNNQADPAIPGYPATTGWDPVTGLGTPNAAALVPALATG
jgi:subtilase family serine protease